MDLPIKIVSYKLLIWLKIVDKILLIKEFNDIILLYKNQVTKMLFDSIFDVVNVSKVLSRLRPFRNAYG